VSRPRRRRSRTNRVGRMRDPKRICAGTLVPESYIPICTCTHLNGFVTRENIAVFARRKTSTGTACKEELLEIIMKKKNEKKHAQISILLENRNRLSLLSDTTFRLVRFVQYACTHTHTYVYMYDTIIIHVIVQNRSVTFL